MLNIIHTHSQTHVHIHTPFSHTFNINPPVIFTRSLGIKTNLDSPSLFLRVLPAGSWHEGLTAMMSSHATVGTTDPLIEQTVYHRATVSAECWVIKGSCFKGMRPRLLWNQEIQLNMYLSFNFPSLSLSLPLSLSLSLSHQSSR